MVLKNQNMFYWKEIGSFASVYQFDRNPAPTHASRQKRATEFPVIHIDRSDGWGEKMKQKPEWRMMNKREKEIDSKLGWRSGLNEKSVFEKDVIENGCVLCSEVKK